MSNSLYHQTSAGFAATASAFVIESLSLIMPWLFVMGALILCDLIAGIAKALRLHERVRFSRAWRDTLAKTCTYFAWVVVACWVQIASGGEVNYSKGACLLVVGIEAASIISNILKWHGYSLDFGMIVGYIIGRLTNAAPHELDGVVHRDDERKEIEETPERKPRGRREPRPRYRKPKEE